MPQRPLERAWRHVLLRLPNRGVPGRCARVVHTMPVVQRARHAKHHQPRAMPLQRGILDGVQLQGDRGTGIVLLPTGRVGQDAQIHPKCAGGGDSSGLRVSVGRGLVQRKRPGQACSVAPRGLPNQIGMSFWIDGAVQRGHPAQRDRIPDVQAMQPVSTRLIPKRIRGDVVHPVPRQDVPGSGGPDGLQGLSHGERDHTRPGHLHEMPRGPGAARRRLQALPKRDFSSNVPH